MDCADEAYHRFETYKRDPNSYVYFRKDSCGWTALDGDRAVGIVVASKCRVGYLHVHPQHRGQEIGTTLLFLALADMRAKGCEAATVVPAQLQATDRHPRPFYEKNGFVVSGLGMMMKKL